MKRSRMKVDLRPSAGMTKRAKENSAEHEYIRMGKAARGYFEPLGGSLKISRGDYEKVFVIKGGLLADLRKIGKKEKRNVGYVTEATYKAILEKGANRAIWVTEDLSELVVGSDPEFGLITSDTTMEYAAHVYSTGRNGQLGHDGPTMELRPTPSASVETHIESIRALLKKGSKSKILNKYKWFSGPLFECDTHKRKFTFGGHIHIGNPDILEALVEPNQGFFTESRQGLLEDVHRRMIRILDDLVGIPLTVLDGPNGNIRRHGKSRDNYGKMGEFRRQAHRFEWRAPSSVWLTDPKLAKTVLTTVKAVTEHTYAHLVDKKFKSTYIRAPQANKNSLLNSLGCLPDEKVLEGLHVDFTKVIDASNASSLCERLTTLTTYSKYKPQIDFFIKLVLESLDGTKIDFFGMKDAWLQDKTALSAYL